MTITAACKARTFPFVLLQLCLVSLIGPNQPSGDGGLEFGERGGLLNLRKSGDKAP